ncbi:hypothetical protein ACCO45_010955 [Purpureocillium lilacinum]
MALGTSSTGRDLLPVTLSLADSASPTDSAPAAVTESTGSFDCDSPVPAVATMDEPALTARTPTTPQPSTNEGAPTSAELPNSPEHLCLCPFLKCSRKLCHPHLATSTSFLNRDMPAGLI